MRSERRRGSFSSILAATISPSLYEVWVKAPRPLQSPIAQMPGDIRLQLIVNRYKAHFSFACHFRIFESEVVGIRAATDCEQHVRARYFALCPLAAINGLRRQCCLGAWQSPLLSRQGANQCLLFSRMSATAADNVVPLARDETPRSLDDSHFAAKAAKDLRELEAHIAATDDDQVRRKEVDVEQGAVGKKCDVLEARYFGGRRHVRLR